MAEMAHSSVRRTKAGQSAAPFVKCLQADLAGSWFFRRRDRCREERWVSHAANVRTTCF